MPRSPLAVGQVQLLLMEDDSVFHLGVKSRLYTPGANQVHSDGDEDSQSRYAEEASLAGPEPEPETVAENSARFEPSSQWVALSAAKARAARVLPRWEEAELAPNQAYAQEAARSLPSDAPRPAPANPPLRTGAPLPFTSQVPPAVDRLLTAEERQRPASHLARSRVWVGGDTRLPTSPARASASSSAPSVARARGVPEASSGSRGAGGRSGAAPAAEGATGIVTGNNVGEARVAELERSAVVPASSSSATVRPAAAALRPSSIALLATSPHAGKLLEDYNIIGAPVGEGTYGTVYRAECKNTGRTVALKHVSMSGKEKDEFPVTTIREVRNLRKLRHANVVELLDICTGTSNGRVDVYLVFEYCPHDLTGLMAFRKQRMKPDEIKCIMAQLLEALDFCHLNYIIHRDLKPSNILLDSDGTLKLCDFGLSRRVDGRANYSTRVITLWYRPPELLLGTKMYDESVDIWSAGCILGELLFNHPLFPESSEVQVVQRICKRQAVWTEEKWPQALRELPLFEKTFGHALRKRAANEEQSADGDLFPPIGRHYGPLCEKLLRKMLALDPQQRCNGSEALNDRWFSTEPMPCPVQQIKVASVLSCHELDVKRIRDKKRTEQQQGQDALKRPGAPADGDANASKRQKEL